MSDEIEMTSLEAATDRRKLFIERMERLGYRGAIAWPTDADYRDVLRRLDTYISVAPDTPAGHHAMDARQQMFLGACVRLRSFSREVKHMTHLFDERHWWTDMRSTQPWVFMRVRGVFDMTHQEPKLEGAVRYNFSAFKPVPEGQMFSTVPGVFVTDEEMDDAMMEWA